MRRNRLFCLAVTLAILSAIHPVFARQKTIILATTQNNAGKWRVHENTGGSSVSAPAIYAGLSYNNIPSITFPFTDNDGFWTITKNFHVPVGATNIVFNVTTLGVDDRAVVELNGVPIASVGGHSTSGAGEMKLKAHGQNKPYDFQYASGSVSVTDTVDIKPGLNKLEIIVNNTGNDIYGSITPPTGGDPTNFGLQATVTYTP